MKTLLEDCYSELKRLIGDEMEQLSVIERVHAHRTYWRPSKTRVVLLAESHVYTTESDLQRSVVELLPEHPDLPRGFVRLVYCLGYGEDYWLDKPAVPKGGTPQFWKVFYSCVNHVEKNSDFAPILKTHTRDCRTRLRNKVQLLERLRANGIWLLDASIAALYTPQRSKPSPELYKKAMRGSWEYIRKLIDEVAAEAILCIGKGVERALRQNLNELGIPWAAVAQPNAHLSAQEHLQLFAIYRSVCKEPHYVRSMLNQNDAVGAVG